MNGRAPGNVIAQGDLGIHVQSSRKVMSRVGRWRGVFFCMLNFIGALCCSCTRHCEGCIWSVVFIFSQNAGNMLIGCKEYKKRLEDVAQMTVIRRGWAG